MKQLQDSLCECCSQVTQCQQELEALKQSQTKPPLPPVAVGWTPVGPAFQSPPSMSYDASGASQVPQHPGEQAGGKTDTACHRCGQEGHWARSCPLGRDRKNGRWGKASQPSAEQADKPKVQTLSDIKGKADVYLPVNLFGCKALVLLDTGCDTSVIGRNLLPTDVEIMPMQRTLFAANKMEITLLGEVHAVFSVAGQEYSADVVVTEAIEELILGIDWLASKACRWDFEHARLGLGDRWVRLQSQPRQDQVRRIYAEGSMAVPAWSQVDLPVGVTWPTLRPAENSLMVEPTTVKEGVITARTLLDKDTFRSAVRVINLSDDSCKIKEGVCLAVAQEACVCGSEQLSGSGPGVQPGATPAAGPRQRLGGGLAAERTAESAPGLVEKRAETSGKPSIRTACSLSDVTQPKVSEAVYEKVLNQSSNASVDTKHVQCVIDSFINQPLRPGMKGSSGMY